MNQETMGAEFYSPRQPMTAKANMTPYGMLSFDRKLDRLEEKKQTKIQAIEVRIIEIERILKFSQRQALTYLEEERDYLKQIEKYKAKHEKVQENRKQKEEKRVSFLIEGFED